MTTLVTSIHNPVVKRARKLRLRKHRAAEGAFVVEGIRPVWEAIDRGAAVERLLWAPDLLTSAEGRRLVERAGDAGATVTALGAEAFRSIAERDHPSGLAAIVRASLGPLGELRVGAHSVFVALDSPADPGNVGAIIRTVDAVGGGGLVLVGDSADPFDPRAVKATMGSLFAVALCRARSLDDLVCWSRDHGVALITTSARAPVELWAADLSPPLVFLLGSERQGLSPEELRRGALAVRIPMAGRASSLNLAVAAGVLLYEYRRRQPATKEGE